MTEKSLIKIVNVVLGIQNINEIEYHLDGEYDPCILIKTDSGTLLLNVHEFASKCKEWAFKQGFVMESYKDYFDKDWKCNSIEFYGEENNSIETLHNAESEYGAVFFSCLYILNRVKS